MTEQRTIIDELHHTQRGNGHEPDVQSGELDPPVAHVQTTVGEQQIPVLGFGTYQIEGNACFDATRAALDAGYRHIDTAMAYENEAMVGRAIATADVDRTDVVVTTKIKGYPEYLTDRACRDAVRSSLERLGTEYVDLLLVHWWNPHSDMEETFGALGDLVDEGRITQIGVSNFSADQLRRAIEVSPVPIVTNQVEYHPYRDRSALLEVCREHDVVLTAYSPLAGGQLIDDPTLAAIGRRYDKSAAQVALRWLIQQSGVITIPKTVTERYLQENRNVFDFRLSSGEMERISALEGPLYYRLTAEWGPLRQARKWAGRKVPKPVRSALPF